MSYDLRAIPPFGSVQCQEWEVVYSISKNNSHYIGKVDCSNLPIPYIFTANSITELKQNIQLWLNEIIATEDVYSLYKEGYSVHLIQDAIFSNYPFVPYGYILVNSENDTYENRISSMTLPSFLQSDKAKYYSMLFPHQEILRDKELVSSHSLYAVKIKPEKCFLSSDSIRHMNLFTNKAIKVTDRYHANLMPLMNLTDLPILLEMAKEQFNMNDLILSYQPSVEEFTLLGSWDTLGIFIPTVEIDHFLLSNYKDRYTLFL